MVTDIKKKFLDGEISKAEFIDRMYQCNQTLFEYTSLIPSTDIKEISITEHGVYFTSKEDGIVILCKEADKRIAPFEIMNFERYESADASMIYSLIEDGYNIFDIGANIGWYSLSIAKKFPQSRVYSFEPVPKTFSHLQQNITLNPFNNINAHNFGFSDVEQELTFYTSRETSVSSSAVNIAENSNAIEIKCKVYTLDQFDQKNQIAVDFIKCDVEGGELFAFKGGEEMIRRHKPVIFTEMLRKWSAKFNYHPNDIINFFKQLDYSCFIITENNTLQIIGEVSERTKETNFIFLHNDKHRSIRTKLQENV